MGKIFIIVTNDCPACKKVEEALKDLAEQGKVEFRDPTKDEFARELAEKLHIEKVPYMVYEGEKGYCRISPDGKVEECVTREEVKDAGGAEG